MFQFRFLSAVIACLLITCCHDARGDDPAAKRLPGTAALDATLPLDVLMVEGIDRFALRQIQRAADSRSSHWHRDYSSATAYRESIAPNRDRLRQIIGAVDPRVVATGVEFISTTIQPSLVAENDFYEIHAVRWPALSGVTAEGLFLKPKTSPVARVIALPDADWTPEMVAGFADSPTRFAAQLASVGCEVLVPTLISRDSKFSRNDAIGRSTNLTHREFIYRQAFELGRHIIGYEVQKVLAAVDQFELRNTADKVDLPIIAIGVSEGGLLALYSGALDDRIDVTVVSGYFDQRDSVWREPIYRNVWSLLSEFSDADIASMIATRTLIIEPSPAIEEIDGPPPAQGRNIAAPGAITRPDPESVAAEINRAKQHWNSLPDSADPRGNLLEASGPQHQAPLAGDVLRNIVSQLGLPANINDALPELHEQRRDHVSVDARQSRQVAELVEYTQKVLRDSYRTRDARFSRLDRSSLDQWVGSAKMLRSEIYGELFGKLPSPTIDPNPRSRRVLEETSFTGYEVVLDVYPDIIAAGILLLPKDLKPNEKRPVVVCQHGLEGTPMDTIAGTESNGYRAYKSFSAELVKRGFIVYAPQNPYRGQDAFRTLQRKSNPMGRSLFSYIIPQHLVTLRWLASLPNVDKDRIGFYGLSYGGKTAVRVPPMLPPTEDEPGYCLSICSADFNEWVSKNASTEAKFSYLWTGEYEIFEWNMGHVANYAELSMLMTPRPFMVERGHDDGVGIDEWVAWEYAKVRRHYNKLGIGQKTEIEFFNGPHTINGQGTYNFLHRHLNWPK